MLNIKDIEARLERATNAAANEVTIPTSALTSLLWYRGQAIDLADALKNLIGSLVWARACGVTTDFFLNRPTREEVK